MKKNKIISAILSGVMAISALGSLAVSAEEEKLYTFSELEAMSEEEFLALDHAQSKYNKIKNDIKYGPLSFKFRCNLINTSNQKPEETENKITDLFGDINLDINVDYIKDNPNFYFTYVELKDYEYFGEEKTDERCLYIAKSYYCLNQIFSVVYEGSDGPVATGKNFTNPVLPDVNGDGKSNIIDAAFIARKVACRKTYELALDADVNMDGKIDIRDAATIARFIAQRKVPLKNGSLIE